MDSYTCACAEGFEGPHCAEDVNECERDTHLCENDATCVVSQTPYHITFEGYIYHCVLFVARTSLEATPATAPCTPVHSVQKTLTNVLPQTSAPSVAHAL